MGFDITGLGSVFDFGSKILDKIFPDKDEVDKAKLALLKMQQEGQFKELDAEVNLALEQAKITAIEAANPSKLISGWRPAIGWVCAASLACYYIPQALFASILWAAQCIAVMRLANDVTQLILPAYPLTLNVSEILGLVGSLLGLGFLRTGEKIKGVAAK